MDWLQAIAGALVLLSLPLAGLLVWWLDKRLDGRAKRRK